MFVLSIAAGVLLLRLNRGGKLLSLINLGLQVLYLKVFGLHFSYAAIPLSLIPGVFVDGSNLGFNLDFDVLRTLIEFDITGSGRFVLGINVTALILFWLVDRYVEIKG